MKFGKNIKQNSMDDRLIGVTKYITLFTKNNFINIKNNCTVAIIVNYT